MGRSRLAPSPGRHETLVSGAHPLGAFWRGWRLGTKKGFPTFSLTAQPPTITASRFLYSPTISNFRRRTSSCIFSLHSSSSTQLINWPTHPIPSGVGLHSSAQTRMNFQNLNFDYAEAPRTSLTSAPTHARRQSLPIFPIPFRIFPSAHALG